MIGGRKATGLSPQIDVGRDSRVALDDDLAIVFGRTNGSWITKKRSSGCGHRPSKD